MKKIKIRKKTEILQKRRDYSMKKIIALLFTLLIGFVFEVKADTPIYGYFWFRYTADNQGIEQFSIDRGYIRWKQKLDSAEITGTVDIAQKKDATQSSDWQIRLKDANVSLTKIIPEGKLIFGLQKTYFGVIEPWEYPVLVKALEDDAKLLSSRDLGVGITGNLPAGLGGYAVACYNGNGYSNVVETNQNKALVASLDLIPIPGITLRGSVWQAKNDDDEDEKRTAGVLTFANGPISLIGEYLTSEDGAKKGAGYSGFISAQIFPKFAVAFRYDQWDKDTAIENNAYTKLVGGFNIDIADNTLLQLNYINKIYEDSSEEAHTQYVAQVKYSF